jgi:hypothetical protein
MSQAERSWPPTVGTPVRIKRNNLKGTVVKTKGVYEARFRLLVPPPLSADGRKPEPGAARAARIASRWYGLDELEPLPES